MLATGRHPRHLPAGAPCRMEALERRAGSGDSARASDVISSYSPEPWGHLLNVAISCLFPHTEMFFPLRRRPRHRPTSSSELSTKRLVLIEGRASPAKIERDDMHDDGGTRAARECFGCECAGRSKAGANRCSTSIRGKLRNPFRHGALLCRLAVIRSPRDPGRPKRSRSTEMLIATFYFLGFLPSENNLAVTSSVRPPPLSNPVGYRH
jgi:hypothetical protein